MTPERPRAARLAAGTLLLAVKKTKADINEAVEEAGDSAVGAADRKGNRKAEILAALLLIGTRLNRNIQRAVLDGRRNARDIGAKRLALELAGLGIVLSAQELATYEHQEDEARAAVAGQALAAAWQAAAMYAALSALRTDEGLAKGLRRAKFVLRGRVDRTAATESAQAFNAERREGLREAASQDQAIETALEHLGRRWDAMLDACPDCADHDGDVTGIDDDFNGDEPGEMHPNCRCVWTLVEVAEAKLVA